MNNFPNINMIGPFHGGTESKPSGLPIGYFNFLYVDIPLGFQLYKPQPKIHNFPSKYTPP